MTDYKIVKPLRTERLGNKLWKLTLDFVVGYNNVVLSVPKGFITNGASVPRMFWWLCAPMAGPFGEAAVIHDYMYSKQSHCIDRKAADRVLRDIGRENGANIIRANLVYSAVRMFGWKFWKSS